MNYIPEYQLIHWPKEKIEEYNSLLEEIYSEEIPGRERLMPLFKFIEGRLADQWHGRTETGLSEIDDLLWLFDPTKADRLINTGILRSSCRVREFLPNWFVCRAKVIEYFKETGVDNWEHLLRGLLKDKHGEY